MAFPLDAYLQRLQLAHVDRRPCPQLLQQLQEQHLRCIPFENLDVVLGQHVKMGSSDVAEKLLLGQPRGGYCFEHNTLMADAARALGFEVEPLLARVRWNKAADTTTTFTHMALRVTCPPASGGDESAPRCFLVDVGFGGIGPLSPLVLGQVLLLLLLLLLLPPPPPPPPPTSHSSACSPFVAAR